jgi:hypothetical protein
MAVLEPLQLRQTSQQTLPEPFLSPTAVRAQRQSQQTNVVLGNGTSAVQTVAPGTSGNVLTSNGTTWQSTAPAASGISAGLSIALAMVMGF